jgi:hypothetical protein
MAKGDIHVMPDKGRWKVETEGSNRVKSRHDRQKDAIQAGRASARRAKVELLVHGRNGQIRDRSSYGNDPRRIPG